MKMLWLSLKEETSWGQWGPHRAQRRGGGQTRKTKGFLHCLTPHQSLQQFTLSTAAHYLNMMPEAPILPLKAYAPRMLSNIKLFPLTLVSLDNSLS